MAAPQVHINSLGTASSSAAARRTDPAPSSPRAEAARAARPSAPEADTQTRTIEDIALYIGQMTTEMATIARSANLQLLAYFLDMARLEANATARRAISQPR